MNNLDIPKATMNQLGNTANPHQGKAIKALCVCSAGLLRSPSIAKYLTERGYNTRACGTSQSYALIPISVALLTWADEVHVVKEEHGLVKILMESLGLDDIKVEVLAIPDMHGTFTDELMEAIKEHYES